MMKQIWDNEISLLKQVQKEIIITGEKVIQDSLANVQLNI